MLMPYGIEIMWLASPQMVGKFRIDGEHFELIDIFFPPGVEDLQSTRAITAKLRQDLVAVYDDDIKTRRLWNEAVMATRAYNYNNAFYAISDLDGHFFVPYGMSIYKFGNVDQDDPLSKIEVKGSIDALQRFPKELVENATGLMGVSMTPIRILLRFTTTISRLDDYGTKPSWLRGPTTITTRFTQSVTWTATSLCPTA